MTNHYASTSDVSKSFVAISVCMAILSSCLPTRAQNDNRTAKQSLHPILRRLKDLETQKELGLTQKQKESIDRLAGEWRREFLFTPKHDEFTDRAAEILTEPQQERFRNFLLRQALKSWRAPRIFARIVSLHREHKLSESQLKETERLKDEWVEEAFVQLRGLDKTAPEGKTWIESEFSKKFFVLSEQWDLRLRDKIAKVLDPQQLKRIQQLELQEVRENQGARVLLNYAVVRETLGLTNEQLHTIRTAILDSDEQLSVLRQAKARGWFKAVQQLRRKTLSDLEQTVLTKDQREKLEDLLGQPAVR